MKRSTAVLLMFCVAMLMAALTSCTSKETWIGEDLERNTQVWTRQPAGFEPGEVIVVSRKQLYGGYKVGNTKVKLTRKVK